MIPSQLPVPAEMLERAAELLDVLHMVERLEAGYVGPLAPHHDEIRATLAGVDPIEVREIQTVLAAFATLNRRAAA
jgi:hypothetical protein